VPERLDLILMKMTAKLPKDRYQTCTEVVKDLESLGLAGTTLSFITQKKVVVKDAKEETGRLSKTTVMESAIKTSSEEAFAEVAAPTLDQNAWYVQMKMPDGKPITRQYTTAQLLKMIGDGTISATAKASHTATEGFRGVGTYKEFQGVALSKITKKGADKNTGRGRGVYKKIEEQERQREASQPEQREETAAQATMHYWLSIVMKFMPYAVTGVIFLCFLTWATSGFDTSWFKKAKATDAIEAKDKGEPKVDGEAKE
jgi:hypothetical protein